MITSLVPSPKFQAFTPTIPIAPLVGGQLFTYAAGTTTPLATYKDSLGITPNTNPVILDANGQCDLWLGPLPYKLVLKDSLGNLLWSVDSVLSPIAQLMSRPAISEIKTASAGQTLFNLDNAYIPGINSLAVFHNGSKLIIGQDYLETSSTSITLVLGAFAGDNLNFVAAASLTSGTGLSAAGTAYLPSGVGAVQTDVQSKLRQMSTLQVATYTTSMTFDVSTGNIFSVTVTNGTAFTIVTPTNPVKGQELIITIRNTSGGALGAITWPSNFKMAAWTSPANGYSRSIALYYDGTNWIERARTTTDVAN